MSPSSPSHPEYTSLKTVYENSHDGFHDNLQVDDDTSTRSSVKGGYMGILSFFLLAVLIACMNHILLSHLDGTEPGSHTSQFWVTVLKNTFPAAVSFLLVMNLKNCLLQVALYHIQRDSHPLDIVNIIISPPSFLNTALILLRSAKHITILSFALLSAITQAVTLTSLFVPSTMTVVSSPPSTQTIKVPTIDFDVADPYQSSLLVDMTDVDAKHPGEQLVYREPSQRWRQLILRQETYS
ncbi:hypothetical protein D9757_004543 [Collybiopsis confluens]|uniref:Uncharacterized protein n=1 Tax=Collybiopsis confluens TaxID=2823264 RepID=A0A8H5ME82_9AGAR|nr:hypothetical protein D9757_004543 [Collybiopsis confluens]